MNKSFFNKLMDKLRYGSDLGNEEETEEEAKEALEEANLLENDQKL